MRSGIFYASITYLCWGLLPLYFHLIKQASALEILGHRVLWSLALLLAYLFYKRRFAAFIRSVDGPSRKRYGLAALLISINWGAYIWGATNGQVLEVSLGYFILPIFSVALGRVFFGERPGRLQGLGVAIAAVGVVYLCLRSPSVPWIAFVVALTFAFYGLVKKKATLPAADGLALETLLLAVPSLGLMWVLSWQGQLVFGHASADMSLLLAGTGLVTVVPLLLFAMAVQRIPLSLVGMLQYVAPTMQFLIGVLVFGEPLSAVRLLGFAIIWLGLVLYVYGFIRRHGDRRLA